MTYSFRESSLESLVASEQNNHKRSKPLYIVYPVQLNAIGLLRWNIATQEWQMFNMEIENPSRVS